MMIGNIEIEYLEGLLCIRRTSMSNALIIRPSELADLRMLLDAIEEQQPPKSGGSAI